ncbi:MAG TPA: hypothetical protein VGP26_20540 [Actinophytocola sp.]|jgi:hypothetical protein|nr:hypothetical protein [Actinophytocola sp.]
MRDDNPAEPANLDLPRPRRRVALIVVAVVCVVAAGVALGLLVATPDSGENGVGLTIAESPEDLPTVALPAGCDLLTPGQLEVLVPGTPTRAGRGPEVVLDATESACDWANKAPDPDDPRVQPASLEVKATAAVDEESARRTMEISLPCQGTHSTKAIVEGADEACLNHKTADKGGPADVATVSARYRTLVVEVSFERRSWPAWRVDDQSAVTAAALIGRVVQVQ